MPTHNHRWFFPSVHIEPELFEIYRSTHQFYQEVQSREAHDRYCEWYAAASEQHRRELEKMRGDVNVFGWFRRRS
ncbi:hypothetical protein H6F51_05100 [Cyanobacteria bacterium FACHB-DQ100]|uniref:hypothetical protein n=1 Tax=unclassified Leptolyngbya TaxID=2650499 RepID=UPI00168174EE|nr:hypothetical protein [Leptolyngbya sp. FACHB-17]MBD1821874.1 hypothetical protein [Cyanobacteria bacterium FACHB-DQ100]MBD2081548.1 hypothetical protein [Leptolyngbya sp. FACHB-17]